MAKKKQTTEREILTIEETKYYLDSVTETGKGLIGNINIINAEMQRLDVQMSIAKVAYDKFLNDLKAEASNFEALPVQPEEDKE